MNIFTKQELFDIAEMLSNFLAEVLCTVASIQCFMRITERQK